MARPKDIVGITTAIVGNDTFRIPLLYKEHTLVPDISRAVKVVQREVGAELEPVAPDAIAAGLGRRMLANLIETTPRFAIQNGWRALLDMQPG